MITVFSSQEPLNLLSLTVMGLSAKPNSKEPIGRFGTGLKYSIAILARMGMKVEIYIEGVRHIVGTEEIDFRGCKTNKLYLEREAAEGTSEMILPLPFTTDYGSHWELWHAFRELYSNTLDEEGRMRIISGDENNPDELSVQDICYRNKTVIAVYGEGFSEVAKNKGEYFLPYEITSDMKSADSFDYDYHPTCHIYYRGIRVYTLEKEIPIRVNLKGIVHLTEDRTLQFPYATQSRIKEFIISKSDDRKLIETFIFSDMESMNVEEGDGENFSEKFIEIAEEVNKISYTAEANLSFSNTISHEIKKLKDQKILEEVSSYVLPVVGELYQHIEKGTVYEIIGTTNENCTSPDFTIQVIYQQILPESGNKLPGWFSRPLMNGEKSWCLKMKPFTGEIQ